jgi:hypothetical protein
MIPIKIPRNEGGAFLESQKKKILSGEKEDRIIKHKEKTS